MMQILLRKLGKENTMVSKGTFFLVNLFVEVRCCVSLDKPGQKGLGFAVLATEFGC